MDDDKSVRAAAPDAKNYHVSHLVKENTSEKSVSDMERPATIKQKIKRWFRWCATHKKASVAATVVLCLALLFAVPAVRYPALGLFVEQDFPVVVIDSLSGKPVSSARIQLEGKDVSTDAEGRAVLRVPVGRATLTISKAHYKTASQRVLVPIAKSDSPLTVQLVSIGRPVQVAVTDIVGRKPVAGAILVAGESRVETDSKGQALLIVPVGEDKIEGTITADGYNKSDITISPTSDEINAFAITPKGKIYFLSNKSGTLDVVGSNLDGTSRETILAGTGREVRGGTVLLATRNWEYLALLSRREGGKHDKLFLINTADGSVSIMDEGEANFGLIGWEGNRFLYQAVRTNVRDWEPRGQALKSFNAETKKITTLDETAAEGSGAYDYLRESYSYANMVDGRLVFVKYWTHNGNAAKQQLNDKTISISSVIPDGSDKKTITSFALSADGYMYADVRISEYNQLHIAQHTYANGSTKNTYFIYRNGKVEPLSGFNDDDYQNLVTRTYLQSPSQKLLLWNENRDGKWAFFVGAPNADKPQPTMVLGEDYQAYGWLSDDYVLLSKKGSELHIAPVTGVAKADELLKVTDYYKSDYSYHGYGGGYGGL